MLNLQRNLTFAFIVAVVIVCIQNMMALFGIFALVAAALCSLQYGLSSRKDLQREKKEEGVTEEPTNVAESTKDASTAINYFPDLEVEEDNLGNDIWATQEQEAGTVTEEPEIPPYIAPIKDDDSNAWKGEGCDGLVTEAVEEAEPSPQKTDELTTKGKENPELPINELILHLESLPLQTKRRRQAWSALCTKLNLQGGGKVRDASLPKKAEFLKDQGIKPEILKRKVKEVALAIAS